MIKRLSIVVTHPVQYYVPLFRVLAKNCELKIFYTWGEKGIASKYDPDFDKCIEWDIPLLDGYTFEILQNNSKDPGSHHFNGINNPEIIERINNFNPDAILIYGWAFKSHLKVLRYFNLKVPIWFRGDSTLLDEQSGFKKMLRKLWLNWIYGHIDQAFYVGTNNKAYYEAFGLKKSQLIFAPHAVDNQRFSENRSKEANQIRTSLNIKDNDILILFAGKLEHKKNPELLLQAFIEIDSSVIDRPPSLEGQDKQATIHLLFVGNGELEERLKSRVRSLESTIQRVEPIPVPKIENLKEEISMPALQSGINFAQDDSGKTNNERRKTSIHFTDFQNQTQMPVIYQACDLFCLPSCGPGETWGLAVNEAMAAGKAVLVSDKVGCAIDLVKQELNGQIFKSGNLNDLKHKLAELLKIREALNEKGKKSAEIISNWTIEQQAKAILKQLYELV